jgi:hypothetical protein
MMDTGLNDGPARTEWRYELLGLLESNEAPRVCTTEELAQLLRRVRPRANADTVHSAIGGLMKAGALQKVSRGLYLNRRSRPAVEVAEAAQHIRQGAVVSLESVLGECGFLNNPPAIVTAVVPQRPDSVPRVGSVKTSGGQVLRFNALPPRFFPSSPEEARLLLQAGRHCPVVKPEVAALHWLHLALSPRSSMRMPPQDVDFSVLDAELLKDLAWRWELSRALEDWKEQIKLAGDIQEPSQPTAPVSEAHRQRGLAARQRLMARRKPNTT